VKTRTAAKLRARDRQRLERALCALADFEGEIKRAAHITNFDHSFHEVCHVLREMLDD